MRARFQKIDPLDHNRHKFGSTNYRSQSLKPKAMKRMIIVMCTWFSAIAAHSQYDERDRLVSINPIRMGDGSFMKANNPLFFNNTSTDTTWSKRKIAKTVSSGDPYAFRISSIQALCDLNSLQLNWTTIQRQPDADHFEIEQSNDGGLTWTNIGFLPATRNETGNVPYNFVYNKSLGTVDLRVAAVNIAGEKRYSSIVHSACSNTNLLSVENLVYNTANVRIGSAKNQNVKMLLMNEFGRVVKEIEAGLTQGVNSISIDMSGLQKGVYMLTIVWPGGGQQSVKIVKQ